MDNGNKKGNRLIIYHIIFWIFYIVYESSYLIAFSHVNTSIFEYCYYYILNICLFYWHFNTLNRGLLKSRSRYLFIGISIVMEMIVVLIFKGIWDYFALRKTVSTQQLFGQLKFFVGLDFYRNLYYLFMSSVIWSAINFESLRKKTIEASLMQALAEKGKSDLQYQYAKAQNAFLKQQINPHLLFNTLNTIYSAVYVNAPNESEAVLLLSEIMRYSYEEPDAEGMVALETELCQLKNLIRLNSYRFGNNVQLDYRINGDPANHRIIPLVLITLTENMFKHGDLRLEPRSVEITISEIGNLTFVAKNVPKISGKNEPTTSVGLINTRLRLDYAYNENYQLDVKHTDELFSLELTINLAYERSNI